MQDNDLPQIGTPMQTDETRVEVSQAMIEAGVEAGWPGPECVYDDAFTGPEQQAEAIYRAMAAFAAPPAVEREEGQPTLADIEHRSLRLQGESANAHGLTVGEPVSEWIAGRMKDAADRALAPSTPTLHPSDREAIARIIEPGAFQPETPHHNRIYQSQTLADARADALAKADAILALSGSLAREGGEKS